MHPLAAPPAAGRVYRAARRIRLSDRDLRGRLRLDAVARYLQDAAGDDVDELGWGAPEHLWVLRHVRIDVLVPPLADDRVELLTWCSATGGVVAGRRLSLRGDRGGRVEVDSVWAHLGPDGRPARIVGFDAYAASAAGRVVSPKLDLPQPPPGARRVPWPLRAADVDVMGHVNNAAYWQAVEQRLADGALDPRKPLRALLGYRHAIDLDDEIELAEFADGGRLALAFLAGELVKAVAWVEQLGAPCPAGPAGTLGP